MTQRSNSCGFIAAVLTAGVLAAVPAAAQKISAPAAANKAAVSPKAFTAPKTPWGDPDLQGQWPADVNIPMQRPLNLAEKSKLTPEELAEREKQFRAAESAGAEEFAKEGRSEEHTSELQSRVDISYAVFCLK